ncbi:LTV-domain-containing protein [Calocera cornea HHB12733]|uniref:LTV-domain-containing protein n=1 Tax=Calocera cornea HHB12733 TaxID=1353952 RepID=A0A165ES58_9BASI|nr:LTV-domain-containing protein [Calocera cornea HHB12733]
MPPKSKSKSKSVFRQPGAQHFQLVHRSQRDPLINDPSASKHVLKGFSRPNDVRKGKSRAELESILGDELARERANVGEAAVYGIYYDDTEYDYMQHLRPIGAPATTKSKGKGKGKAVDLELRLPADALPSEKQRSQLEAQDALLGVPQSLAGFQPDMDPHLRQALEALEDDAFVLDDDGGGDGPAGEDPEDFFGELLADGEAEDEGQRGEWEFEEWGVDDAGRPERGVGEEDGDGMDDLARRVKAFKLAQARGEGLEGGSEEEGPEEEEVEEELEVSDSEMSAIRARLSAFQLSHKPAGAASDAWSDEGHDQDQDQFGGSEAGSTLPPLPVIGGKRRRAGAYSDASGFSMSSSSVWRSAGQKMVDDRFDEVEKAYEEGASDSASDDDAEGSGSGSDEAPNLVNSRADFEAVIDGFMSQYEQVGNHVRPTSEKLDTLRRAMGAELRARDMRAATGTGGRGADGDDDEGILMPVDVDEVKDTWDVETILSTYSNLENHPRVISARADVGRGVKRIRLDTRTGLPTVEEEEGAEPRRSKRSAGEEQPSPEKRQKLAPKAPIVRAKTESAEEKKARKAAVKLERQERRAVKKATKTAFSTERKNQLKNVPASAVTAVAMKL